MVHEGILDTYKARNNYSGDLFLCNWNEMLLRLYGFRNKYLFSLKKNQILKQKPLYLPFATKDIWSSKMFKFLFLILLSLLTIWAPPWKEEYVPIIILRLLILLVAIVAVAVTANKWFICTLIQYYTILFY